MQQNMSDTQARLSWTHLEFVGEALIPDEQEHPMGLSMEIHNFIWDQWLNALSFQGYLGFMILSKGVPEKTQE